MLDEFGALPCAYCKGSNTHQFVVVVHNRSDEDRPVRATVVRQGRGPDAFTIPKCPSTRRDAASVGFTCETCSLITWLHVAQHKGQSFVTTEVGC